MSAGAICWFESGVTDSYGPTLTSLDCLGFLNGSHCPHYDGEATRRSAYHRLIRDGMPGGFAADDSAGLLFVDGELDRVVASRSNATAYRVELQNGDIRETPLTAELLKSS